MSKKLLRSVREYKRQTILTPVFRVYHQPWPCSGCAGYDRPVFWREGRTTGGGGFCRICKESPP